MTIGTRVRPDVDASVESEIDKIAEEIDRLQKDGDPEGRIWDLNRL